MTGQRGFSMVPAWLLVKKPKGNDVLIYCTLASHGTWNPGTGVYESCKPSIDLMCEETGLSRSSVKRALDNLLELKAVRRTLQFTDEGDPAPSLYQVIFGQVIEPVEEGVGSQMDRPQAPPKKTRSQGGRSTDEPTSVHGRTEGRSTCEPRVGPQVDRNQEPLNQEPITKSSEAASRLRRDADEADQADGQITIDGQVEPPAAPREITNKDVANEIARVWIGYWSGPKKNTPIGGGAPHVLQAKMTSLVLGFLDHGYSREEIGKALNVIGEPVIPEQPRLQRALAAGRGHQPPAQQRNRAGARVNGYWDGVRATEGEQPEMATAAVGADIQTTGAAW